MPQFGTYNPSNAENTSSFFVFQEVPVTSTKLNRWNGNIESGFLLLHRLLAAVVSQSQDAVIATGDDNALKVIPDNPLGMTVAVQPGWAVVQNTLAGLTAETSVPIGGTFTVPVSNPRIDLVILRSTGLVDAVIGTESSSPQLPEIPQEAVALASLFHRPGATQILQADNGTQSYITDLRPQIILGEAHKHAPDRIPPETPDGTRTGFSTQHTFRQDSLDVFLNGVLQEKDSDFTEDSDRRGYHFNAPPLAAYRIQHRYLIETME